MWRQKSKHLSFALLLTCLPTHIQAANLIDALIANGAAQFAATLQQNIDLFNAYNSTNVKTIFAPIDNYVSNNTDALARRALDPAAVADLSYQTCSTAVTLGAVQQRKKKRAFTLVGGKVVETDLQQTKLTPNNQSVVAEIAILDNAAPSQSLLRRGGGGYSSPPENPGKETTKVDTTVVWQPPKETTKVYYSVQTIFDTPPPIVKETTKVILTTVVVPPVYTTQTIYRTQTTINILPPVVEQVTRTLTTTQVVTPSPTTRTTLITQTTTQVLPPQINTVTRTVTSTTVVQGTTSTRTITTTTLQTQSTPTTVTGVTTVTSIQVVQVPTTRIITTTTVGTQSVPTTVTGTVTLTSVQTVTAPTVSISRTTTSISTSSVAAGVVPNPPIKLASGLGNKVNLLKADIPYDGGLLQITDGYFTIPKTVSYTLNYTGLTGFLGLINSANLTNTIDNLHRVTIFAPSNAAIANLRTSLTSQASIQNFVYGQIIPNFLGYLPVLNDITRLTTLANTSISVTRQNNIYILNGVASIIDSDIVTDNGVIHAINATLSGAVQQSPSSDAVPLNKSLTLILAAALFAMLSWAY